MIELEEILNVKNVENLLEIKNFSELESHDFLEQFKSIYFRIPEYERLSIETLKDRVENNSNVLGKDKYHLVLAKTDNEILGYSVGRWFNNIDTGFVSYLGTIKKLECNGIGTKVRNSLIDKYKEDSNSHNRTLNTVVGEISSNNSFYLGRMSKRSDISFLNIMYEQGEYDGLQGDVPLNLYVQVIDNTKLYKGKLLFKEVEVKRVNGETLTRYAVHKDYVKDLLSTIYKKIYKDNNSKQFYNAINSVDKYDDYVMPFLPQ